MRHLGGGLAVATDPSEPLSREAAGVLRQFPGPVVFQPDRIHRNREVLALSAGLAILPVGGWLFFRDGDWGKLALMGATFVGIAVALGLLLVAWRRRWLWLELDATGFAYPFARNREFKRWSEVSSFSVARDGNDNDWVVYDDPAVAPALAVLERADLRGKVRILDLYGFAPDELACVLNAWRERALQN